MKTLFFLLLCSENFGIKSLRNFKTLKQNYERKGKMKPKRKLKTWVKVALLLLPQAVMIMELFLIGLNLKYIKEQPRVYIISGGGYCE